MSPFAQLLRKYRIQRRLRQSDLAQLIGYEQSYVSSLELGLKGPPHTEFVDQFIQVMGLNLDEKEELQEAVLASQRKIEVPAEAATEIYWLCHQLRQQIDQLHPIQVELITTALNLPKEFDMGQEGKQTRLRRRSYKPTVQEDHK